MLLWFIAGISHSLSGQVSITAIGAQVSQNFNSLAAPSNTTGTSTPAGWYFSESGTNQNTSYTVNNGSSNTGDTYSYGPGSGSTTDRAFGTLRSGSIETIIGAGFINNSGQVITQLQISYTGEYWRCGTAGRLDRLDFSISTNATSITTGTWLDVNDLDFDNNGLGDCPATTGNKDGNSCGKSITYTITNLSIANGATFYIRWTDLDASGSDDGMAIDDFSLVASNVNGGGTGSNLFIYDNVNNLVGLGKNPLASPPVKLDINGNLRTTGKFFVGITDDSKVSSLADAGYAMAVNGSLLAAKMIVKKYENWPDYVFEDDYKLTPLSSLRKYISQFHHLPSVPSAKKIAEGGIDLAEMQALSIKKIEELTLYILHQQEQINRLDEEIESLKSAIKKNE